MVCSLPANFKQAILTGGKNEHTSKWLQAVMEDPKVSAVMGEQSPSQHPNLTYTLNNLVTFTDLLRLNLEHTICPEAFRNVFSQHKLV